VSDAAAGSQFACLMAKPGLIGPMSCAFAGGVPAVQSSSTSSITIPPPALAGQMRGFWLDAPQLSG
jgi:hypothetical protein